MKDPAHAASEIVQEALAPYFPGGLSPTLGGEVYLTIRRRLHSSRYGRDDHIDEVFQCTVLDAYEYLKRHGSADIRHTRGWLHRIGLNATRRYLKDISRNQPACQLTPLLEGQIQLSDNSVEVDDNSTLARVRRAIDSLRPSYRDFLYLDLVEAKSPAEIQAVLGIESYAYFRKLKCDALASLRAKLQDLFAS